MKNRIAYRSGLAFPCADFPVTCAGGGRHDGEFCFGAEDGRLRFTTVGGELIDETWPDEQHSEAVNGVAFCAGLVAVSSRSELVFWEMPQRPESKSRPAPLSCGSHGVITTASGYFIAPLGANGLMKMRAVPREGQPIKRIRARGELVDFYRVISIESGAGDLLVCAARNSGVATIELADGAEPSWLAFTTHGDLDVVDVCSLATADAPRAVAGLCRDGRLLFSNDALNANSFVCLKDNRVEGSAYRVLFAQGTMIVLTSRGLYILPDLAQRLQHDLRAAALEFTGLITIEAVDANLVNDRWLLVTLPDVVRRYDVAGFAEECRPRGWAEARDVSRDLDALPVTSRAAEAEVSSLSSAA